QGGRMVEIGPPSEVLTDRLLRQNFGVCGHFLTDPTDGSPVIRFHMAHR
ncbi:MAG: histidinol phosphatase, partial [Roseovarius sp.]|nr:histidinol phosphatase [Roseovarius sp.]